MSPVRLSVCIPVYNFAPFVGPTVSSIAAQAPAGVEVLVVDGASTDDTPRVARELEARFPNVRYVRLDRRGGIDRDIARAVEAAQGDYCWLFGGDDLVRPGAVAAVLAELESGCDVYLLESMLCDLEMRPLGMHRMLDVPAGRAFRLDDPAERREYFARARNTAAFFSFCSSVVVSRARWQATPVADEFMGTCWAHAARIFSMLPAGLTVKYVPDPMLDKRCGNDSFARNGVVQRFGIAVDGYHRIADVLFGHDSPEAFHIRRTVRAEQPWLDWLYAKREIVLSGRREQLPLYNRLLRKQFSDPSLRNWAAFLACRLTPGFALDPLKRGLDAYRAMRARARGAADGAPPPGALR